jgi:hypothetical protein
LGSSFFSSALSSYTIGGMVAFLGGEAYRAGIGSRFGGTTGKGFLTGKSFFSSASFFAFIVFLTASLIVLSGGNCF